MVKEILAAMAGVWAFGVLFRAPRRSYFFCALAGAISWGVYALAIRMGWSVFPATAAASMCLTLYSRVLAVGQKLPSTIFIVTGIFPIVPGAGIYYTAYYLVMKNYPLATAKGLETLAAAGAIALGILAGSELPHRRAVAGRRRVCYTEGNTTKTEGGTYMSARKVAMLVHPDDNVICVIEDVQKGEEAFVALQNEGVVANEFIKQGHKIARRDIKKGEPVIKYGTTVGLAKCDIQRGDWVHDHNELDITEELIAKERDAILGGGKDAMHFTDKPYKMQTPKVSRTTVMGYPRKDGRFGIRNYVIVISLVQCSNTAAQKIALACGDIPAIVVEAACGEFAERFARTRLGFITAGIHPNVYGVLLLSLGCQQADPNDIAGEIKKYGKEVEQLCIQTDGGQTKVIEKGIELVKGMQQRASAQKRVPCPIADLQLGGYNGGSDWTSGLSANPVVGDCLDVHDALGGIIVGGGGRGGQPEKCATLEIALQMLEIGRRFNEDCTARSGKGLSEVNPTPGNKAGGLTTLTEKNLGSHKTGGHAKIRKVLLPGEIPPGHGGYCVNQPQGANDSYAVTTQAMAGNHLCLFTTGRGNPIGNAVMPSVKVTGNPVTYGNLTEFFDYSAVAVLRGEKSLEQAGLELYEKILDICDGELTCSEKLHDWSYTIPHGTSYNGDYEKPCQN